MAKTPHWAVVPHNDIHEGVEVRLNDDGTIDEVCWGREDVSFHLEQMDDGQYWIGLGWTDAEGEWHTQHVMLTRHGKHIYPTVYT